MAISVSVVTRGTRREEVPRVAYVYPTSIGITRGTLSVAILVAVTDGVDILVALRSSFHLYSVRNARAGLRIVKRKS